MIYLHVSGTLEVEEMKGFMAVYIVSRRDANFCHLATFLRGHRREICPRFIITVLIFFA
jgi:hypothetical protein